MEYAEGAQRADLPGMSMFEWKPVYSVDHSEIDGQHKHLFQLADELGDALAGGKSKAAMGTILASLIDYTQRHFASEERLMQMHQYPEYAAHKKLHDDLTARVVEFQKNFVAGRTSMSVDLLHFLKDWLSHHIGESDKKIAAYLKAKAA